MFHLIMLRYDISKIKFRAINFAIYWCDVRKHNHPIESCHLIVYCPTKHNPLIGPHSDEIPGTLSI